MSYVLEEIEKEGYKAKIISDDDPINPRKNYDNLGVMICFHRKYDLGDDHEYADPEAFHLDIWIKEATEEEKRRFVLESLKGRFSAYRKVLNRCSNRKDIDEVFEETAFLTQAPRGLPDSVIHLPLYLYDHGGITMSTGSFSCPWDSGQVGYIYLPKKKIEEEFSGLKRTSDDFRTYLNGEVETYDQYLTGDVWGFVIEDPEGEQLDSCWGFFGSVSAKEEAEIVLRAEIKDGRKAAIKEEQEKIWWNNQL